MQILHHRFNRKAGILNLGMILVEQTIGYREKSIYIDPIIAAHLFDRLIAESQRDTKTAHNQQYRIISHTNTLIGSVFLYLPSLYIIGCIPCISVIQI